MTTLKKMVVKVDKWVAENKNIFLMFREQNRLGRGWGHHQMLGIILYLLRAFSKPSWDIAREEKTELDGSSLNHELTRHDKIVISS